MLVGKIVRFSRMIVVLAALTISLLGPAPAVASGAKDAAELARTWADAWVFIPSSESPGYTRNDTAELNRDLSALSKPVAAVIVYAHGCSGLNVISEKTARFLAEAGYLVVAPDSFARADKPVSCVPARHRGGLHRGVLAWRHAEMANALHELSGIENLVGVSIILMGHSEGAITVATISAATIHQAYDVDVLISNAPGFGGQVAERQRSLWGASAEKPLGGEHSIDVPVSGPVVGPVAGRIIEGWTCHAGWPEYRGLKAPPGEPVLALVSADDPWFTLPVLHGDCGAYMEGEPASRPLTGQPLTGRPPTSRSVVYREPGYLHNKHWLSFDRDVQATILGFISSIVDR